MAELRGMWRQQVIILFLIVNMTIINMAIINMIIIDIIDIIYDYVINSNEFS